MNKWYPSVAGLCLVRLKARSSRHRECWGTVETAPRFIGSKVPRKRLNKNWFIEILKTLRKKTTLCGATFVVYPNLNLHLLLAWVEHSKPWCFPKCNWSPSGKMMVTKTHHSPTKYFVIGKHCSYIYIAYFAFFGGGNLYVMFHRELKMSGHWRLKPGQWVSPFHWSQRCAISPTSIVPIPLAFLSFVSFATCLNKIGINSIFKKTY